MMMMMMMTIIIIIIIIICVYYDMTVTHQYSTLKNETLKYTCNIKYIHS